MEHHHLLSTPPLPRSMVGSQAILYSIYLPLLPGLLGKLVKVLMFPEVIQLTSVQCSFYLTSLQYGF